MLQRKRKAKALTDPGNTLDRPAQDDDQYPRKELAGGEVSPLDSNDAKKEIDGRIRYQLSDEAAIKPELADAEPLELSTGPRVKRKLNERTESYIG